MAGLSLAFSVLVAAAVLLGFIGLWRLTVMDDPIDARLKQYGGDATGDANEAPEVRRSRRRFRSLNRRLDQLALGETFADRLTRADVPLTVVEFLLIVFALTAGLALVGWWRGGALLGGVLGITGLFLPLIYLNVRASRRREAFTNQLPDVLTLLVGALRAGYGVAQAIDMLVDRMAAPASVEFSRVMRAVSLGIPVNRALNDMADRARSDDLYLVVTAMNVQAELGGNLAQILETITETIRQRIRIKREIQVMTAQQGLTGYLIAGLPVAFGLAASVISPGYITPLFEPGLMRLVVIAAVMMQLIGYLIIRKIVDIEV